MTKCVVRIDRRHCSTNSTNSTNSTSSTSSTISTSSTSSTDSFNSSPPQTWKANETTTIHLPLSENATVKELKDKIQLSPIQCHLSSYDIIAIPYGVPMLEDHVPLSDYLMHIPICNKQILYCIVVPTNPPELDSIIPLCMSCAPINIIHPNVLIDNKESTRRLTKEVGGQPQENTLTLDTPTFLARIHDDSLAKVLSLLPSSEICGLFEIYESNGCVLNATVTVKGNHLVCTLQQPLKVAGWYCIVLHGKRFSAIELIACCARHTPEAHDLENQYVPFEMVVAATATEAVGTIITGNENK